MYKHILVPLDSSPLAEKAIPHAQQLAELTGARITLMSCVEPYVITMPMVPAPVPAYEIDTDMEALVADREEYLEVVRDALAAKPLNVDVVVLRGRPADEILRFVEGNEVDLIVMTTHGRSGLSRFIYGSVAERVLHGAKVPALLIRITE
ncbi:MAG: universal stress protein [Armatimonadota bacterium]|nr:universal stress protein [Armatimonadota bacterium]